MAEPAQKQQQQQQQQQKTLNASQGKIVHTCISTPTPPQNHHILSLQHLVLLCITSSAYNFYAYRYPRDTMFNTIKAIRH